MKMIISLVLLLSIGVSVVQAITIGENDRETKLYDFNIQEDDENKVEATIEQIDNNTFLITINKHPENKEKDHRWDVVVCNEGGLFNVEYEEKEKAEKRFKEKKSSRYEYLLEKGMSSKWCESTGGFGYTIKQNAKKTELPYQFKLKINDQATAFKIFAGRGSVTIEASASNPTYHSNGDKFIYANGKIHGIFRHGSTTIGYFNATNNAEITNGAFTDLTVSSSETPGITASPNGTLLIYFDDGTKISGIYSYDNGVSWTSEFEIMNPGTENDPRCISDSNNIFHCVTDTNVRGYYTNSSIYGSHEEVNGNTADDTDFLTICVNEDNNCPYVIGSGTDQDDLDLWTTTACGGNGWGDSNRIQLNNGGAFNHNRGKFNCAIKEDKIYVPFIDSSDLHLATVEIPSFSTSTQTLDTQSSGHPNIVISPAGQCYIVYMNGQTVGSSTDILLNNATDCETFTGKQTNYFQQNNAGYPNALKTAIGHTPIHSDTLDIIFTHYTGGAVIYQNITIFSYNDSLEIDYPLDSNILTTSSQQTETIGFKVYSNDVEQTSGVELDSITINDVNVTVKTSYSNYVILEEKGICTNDIRVYGVSNDNYGFMSKCDITSVPSGLTINLVEMCGDIEGDLSNPLDDDIRVERFADQSWQQGSIVDSDFESGTFTNTTTGSLNSTTVGDISCFQITEQFITEYTAGNSYVSVFAEDPDHNVNTGNVNLANSNNWIGGGSGTEGYLWFDDNEGNSNHMYLRVHYALEARQFGYNGTSWVANITTPSLSDGTYDFFLNATIHSNTIGAISTNSVKYGDGGAPSSTCEYSGSGDFNVDCSENCIISETNNLNGNNFYFYNSGTVHITGSIQNFGQGVVSPQCVIACYNGGFCFS